jgi:hypothetical protein
MRAYSGEKENRILNRHYEQERQINESRVSEWKNNAL